MGNGEQLEVLKQGASAWNEWRLRNGITRPVFSRVNLKGVDLRSINLCDAEITFSNLDFAHLDHACLAGANFTRSSLIGTHLKKADLRGAKLPRSLLMGADFSMANLKFANLEDADLLLTNFISTELEGSDFSNARTLLTVFADVDLREVKGLERVKHRGPSEISFSTIYKSEGKIPEVFLRGCGLPESLINLIPSLVTATQPIQFYSCFISYSTKDEDFAKRLHARMRQEGLRVWFAPEDMKGGDYFSDQIDRAIQVHDRLLLVLSKNSIASNWVIREIKRARKAEEREGRKKLFPISLTSYEVLRGWEHLEHDSGIDLAEEVRKYHIPDFSNWKNHDDFEREFKRLYESLKATA